LAFAKDLGLKQMIVSTFGLPKDAKMADWMHAVDEANKFGERTRKAGIQLGFHNHDFEFQKIDGELIYDKLMGEFDPKLVKMQFQVSVIRLGYQAADYFEKYPGRFISIHLQDWSPTQKKEVALGQGVVDWKRLWAAAKKSGARNYFVETDRAISGQRAIPEGPELILPVLALLAAAPQLQNGDSNAGVRGLDGPSITTSARPAVVRVGERRVVDRDRAGRAGRGFANRLSDAGIALARERPDQRRRAHRYRNPFRNIRFVDRRGSPLPRAVARRGHDPPG
jgi:hypothetical protein